MNEWALFDNFDYFRASFICNHDHPVPYHLSYLLAIFVRYLQFVSPFLLHTQRSLP